MFKKIEEAINKTVNDLAERDESVRLSVLATLAGEHIVLLGPPGTAKSLIARRTSLLFDDFNYFEYLLTKFTVPEEIFGPLSLKALENDRFERKTAGFIPQANIVFLDEIFKANSSILNSLLSLINERVFYNGANRVKVPLVSLIGASNEIPVEGEGLDALYDRFLIRYIVKPIESDEQFLHKIIRYNKQVAQQIKLDNKLIEEVKNRVDDIIIDEQLESKILSLHSKLKSHDIYVSDRRWKKGIKLIKIVALISGKSKADAFDALVLKHVLWSFPQDRDLVFSLVVSTFLGEEDDTDQRKFLSAVAADFQKIKARISGSSWNRPLICSNMIKCSSKKKNDDYLGGCENFIPSMNGGCMNYKGDVKEETWFAPAKSSYHFTSNKAELFEKTKWSLSGPLFNEFKNMHDKLTAVHKKIKDNYAAAESALKIISDEKQFFFKKDIEKQKQVLEVRVSELRESYIAVNAVFEKVNAVFVQLSSSPNA